jgi:hypothetical protein
MKSYNMSDNSTSYFESIYVDIVNYCMVYNTKVNYTESLFTESRFVHIKGGSSIKYHLMRAQVPPEYHTHITSDLDIFLVCDNEYVDENISDFITGLQEIAHPHVVTSKSENGLTKIAINGIDVIDLTAFTESYEEMDPDGSMFYYACERLGKTENEYFEELKQIDNTLTDRNHELLEKKTFTSVEFEYYATEKGLSIYAQHLENVPMWRQNYEIYYRRSLDVSLPDYERANALRIAERYQYQSSEVFVAKLRNKFTRYQNKLMLLEQLLRR